MHTNDDAIDFRLLVAPTSSDWTDPSAWTELVAHVAGRRIIGADPFAEHLVIQRVGRRATPPAHRVPRRQRARSSTSATRRTTSTSGRTRSGPPSMLRFGTQSTTVPPTLYDEDVASGDRTLLKQVPDAERRPRPVPIGAPVGHRARRRAGADRHRAPRRHTARRHRPGVIYGYGAYEASMPPWFSVARLSLLDRGFVWALVHPRGGGELGRQWYLDGKLESKAQHVHRHDRVRRAPDRDAR